MLLQIWKFSMTLTRVILCQYLTLFRRENKMWGWWWGRSSNSLSLHYRRLEAALWEGWAFEPGRFQGHWFSGQVIFPLWVCFFAHHCLAHHRQTFLCSPLGEMSFLCLGRGVLTSGVWHHAGSAGACSYSLSCSSISSSLQLLPFAVNTGLCLEHMFARCCYPFLLIFCPLLYCQVCSNRWSVATASISSLSTYSRILYVLVPTASRRFRQLLPIR